MSEHDPYAPPDLRNHLSMMERKNLNWLTSIHAEAVPILASYRREAAEFADDDLDSWLDDWMELATAIGGARAELAAKVAGVDEQRKHAPEGQKQDGPKEPAKV